MNPSEQGSAVPSRDELIQAVNFLKAEYQKLVYELTDKTQRLEELTQLHQSSHPDTFEVEMQNYELKSQFNREKMLHIEQLNEMTVRHNRQLQELQQLVESRQQQQLEDAAQYIRQLEAKLAAPDNNDGTIVAAMKEKMAKTEELLNRLNQEYSQAMEQRNMEISRLEKAVHQTSRYSVSSTYSDDTKQRHLQHIAQLEDRVGQLVASLKQYESGRPSVSVGESEFHAALDQQQRLNHQLTDELEEAHRRLAQLTGQYDTLHQHNLVNMEQLRNRDGIIHEQQAEIEKLAACAVELEKKILQLQTDKERELDEALRTTVEKFQSKIESLQRRQSDHSNRASLEPLEFSNHGSELESELKELKRRLQDQNIQLDTLRDEKDSAQQRNRELQAQLSSLMEQLRMHSQTPNSQEIERLQQQNNDYREKFGYLQKEAKRILDEHRETIQKLQINLEEANSWNRQLREQEEVFKREYQLLLASQEELQKQLREHQATAVRPDNQATDIRDRTVADIEKETAVRMQLEEKLREANELAELNAERLELLKVSKKDLEKKLQESQGRAKEADKRCSASQSKLKRLTEAQESLKQQLHHRQAECRKLQEHCQAIKQRQEQEVRTMQRSFEEMSDRLVAQKKLLEERKAALFSEQTAQFQRVNQQNMQLESQLRQKSGKLETLEKEVGASSAEKKEMLGELTQLQSDRARLEESIANKESLIRLKDARINELGLELEQLRQEHNTSQDHSIIVADKDRVYEYILELEEKCRLLQGFAVEVRKSEAVAQEPRPSPIQANLVNENAQLRKLIERLEKEVGEARLQTNSISLEFERHKRQSLQEMLLLKQSQQQTVSQLYRQIDLMSSKMEGAALQKPQTAQFATFRERPQTFRPSSQLAVSSLQSPLSFNTLPEGAQGRVYNQAPATTQSALFHRETMNRPWLRSPAAESMLAGSFNTAKFGRRS